MQGYEHIDAAVAGSVTDTAVWLVGTMHEHGLDSHSVVRSDSGFWITPQLADILRGDDEEPEAEPEVVEGPEVKKTRRNSKKNASGAGAEKNETEE